MQNRAFADGESSYAFDSEIEEKGSTLAGVALRNVRTGKTRDLGVSGPSLAIGHDPRTPNSSRTKLGLGFFWTLRKKAPELPADSNGSSVVDAETAGCRGAFMTG